MHEKLRCAMNEEELSRLDPRLFIQEFTEQIKRKGDVRAPGGPAAEERTLTLRFLIKERDRAARQRLLSRVNAWAREGWLTVDSRPGQRLYAVCAQPAGGTSLRWYDDMQLVFTARGPGGWQDREPLRVSASGSDVTLALRPAGTRPCRLEARAVNASGHVITGLSLAVNGRTLAFSGLSLADGEIFSVFYDAYGLMRAEAAGASVLGCRTAASDDDLWLYPGRENAVRFTADGACGVTLRARGEYD